MPTKALHFSDVEKKAILSTAYEVVLADGSIHPTEVAAIKKLIASMDLTNSLAKEAQEMSIDEALVPLNNMDYDKKRCWQIWMILPWLMRFFMKMKWN